MVKLVSILFLACGAFQKVEHGSFVLTIPEYNVLGATAELTCCSGYHADGATNITCGVNSTWSTTSGTCEANGKHYVIV